MDPAEADADPKRFVTHTEPPDRAASYHTGVFRLPPQLLAKARERVTFLVTALAILFAFAAVVEAVFEFTVADYSVWGLIWVLIGLALSLVFRQMARNPRLLHGRVLRIGLIYEILLCLLMAVATQDVYYGETGHFVPVTWAVVVMVIFPLVVPSPPRIALGVSIVAAAMSPLGLFIVATTLGAEIGFYHYADVSVGPVAAIVLAYFSAKVVYDFNVDVARAQELGPYRLQERLGRGGMGEVWRAKHRLLARPAAVKLIRPRILEDADSDAAEIALKRFEREAQVTANLGSPHTIELYDFGITDNGILYYVMELLDGLDLDTLVRNHGAMPAARVIHILRQACDSLAEAHRTGLVHRDIKPANLFLCHQGIRDDFTKLLDFGLVALRMDHAADMTQLSTTDAIRGTPHFIAPEVARGGKNIDGRADLYCLGCVAYWMLTGKPVFEREGPLQVILAHLNDMPPALEDVASASVPAPLSKLILECLQKDPADRPPNAEVLERRLAEIAERHPWTQEEASEWWRNHEPGVGPDDPMATSH